MIPDTIREMSRDWFGRFVLLLFTITSGMAMAYLALAVKAVAS